MIYAKISVSIAYTRLLFKWKTILLGGSDDAAGCAVMLEVLRIITQSPEILKHSIIFLFNGAEENILQVILY